jgi:hypothetical protein
MMRDYGVLLTTNIPGFPVSCFWLMWSNLRYSPLAVPLPGQSACSPDSGELLGVGKTFSSEAQCRAHG